MKTSGIYKITNEINKKYYVGSSNDVYKRWNQHKLNLNKKSHKNPHLQNAWNKYGADNFCFIIVEKIMDSNRILDVEQKYLDIANNEHEKCYNCGFIAGKVEMTADVRRKISEKRKMWLSVKENCPTYGKHLSRETKEKLRIANLGKKRTPESIEKSRIGNLGKLSGPNHPNWGKHPSEETRNKQRMSMLGKHHTDITKSKIGIANRGEKHSEEWIARVKERNSKTWAFISPLKETIKLINLRSFCRENHLDAGAMIKVNDGRASHHKQWTKYAPQLA